MVFFVPTESSFLKVDGSTAFLPNSTGPWPQLEKDRKIPGILHECSCFINFINQVAENEFNKFNNTRARMLDSIYHVTLRLL